MSQGRFNLSALAVRERAVTLFLIFLISLAGLISFFKLGRAEDPAFTVKVMNRAQFPPPLMTRPRPRRTQRKRN